MATIRLHVKLDKHVAVSLIAREVAKLPLSHVWHDRKLGRSLGLPTPTGHRPLRPGLNNRMAPLAEKSGREFTAA